MIKCEGELNGGKVAVHLAVPVIRIAEAPSEVYFDHLRIEVAGLGVLRIPLSKINELLSSQVQLAPASSSSKSKIKSDGSPIRGKLRLLRTGD